jgi:hypothetical protein
LKNEFEKKFQKKKEKLFSLSLSLSPFTFGPQPTQAGRPFSFSFPRARNGPSWPNSPPPLAQHRPSPFFFCSSH